MPSWGTYELFTTGEYNSPFPSIKVSELELIPAGIDTPSTTIQTGGRGRKKAAMGLWIENTSDYDILYNDYLTSTAKTYIGFRDEQMTALISDLTPPVYLGDGSVECRVTFIEV